MLKIMRYKANGTFAVVESGRKTSFFDTVEEAKADLKRRQRNARRRERDQIRSDLGLKRVRGALGGIYWE